MAEAKARSSNVPMNIAMAPEDKKFLKLLAVQRGCTAADLITECVHGLAASNRDVAVLAGVACAPGACDEDGTCVPAVTANGLLPFSPGVTENGFPTFWTC